MKKIIYTIAISLSIFTGCERATYVPSEVDSYSKSSDPTITIFEGKIEW